MQAEGRDRAAAKITATSSHPFWVQSHGEWVEAEDLQHGYRLRTPEGAYARVMTLRSWSQQDRVHNLTVDDLRTYYVLAGTTPVLVHNCPMATGRALQNVRMPKSFGGVDLEHTKSGHMVGGSRVHQSKDLWPSGTTDDEIVSTARQAFRNNPTVTGYDSQTNMIRAQSTVNGRTYEMMVNKGTGEVRSIYPKGGRR